MSRSASSGTSDAAGDDATRTNDAPSRRDPATAWGPNSPLRAYLHTGIAEALLDIQYESLMLKRCLQPRETVSVFVFVFVCALH